MDRMKMFLSYEGVYLKLREEIKMMLSKLSASNEAQWHGTIHTLLDIITGCMLSTPLHVDMIFLSLGEYLECNFNTTGTHGSFSENFNFI